MYGDFPVMWYWADVRCLPKPCRQKNDLYGRWGAPRLRAAAFASIPACLPSPLAASNHPRFSIPTAARPRPNALTLDTMRATAETVAPYSVAPLAVAHTQRFPLRRASTLSLFAGLVLTAVTLTPPRLNNASPPSERLSIGRTSRARQACNIRALRKRILKIKGLGLMAIGWLLVSLSFELIGCYLAFDTALSGDVLRVVVHIDFQAGCS